MSSNPLNRRQFLTLALTVALAPIAHAVAAAVARHGTYAADVGLLYDFFKLHLAGTIDESVDRAAGRYEVRIVGEGSSIANRIESTGQFVDGRWAPVRMTSWFR